MIRAAAAMLLAAACGGSRASATTPAPPRAASCDTPAVIAGQADADALAGCRTLPALTIRTAALVDTAQLPLTAIPGDLTIGPSVGLEQVTLPRLAQVGGAIRVVGNGSLTTLQLPALATAHAVIVEGNVELRLILVPALAHVATDLRIARAASLTMIDARALIAIGGALSITEAPSLDVIEVPRLTQVGKVEITRTDLTADQLQELAALAP